MATISDDFTSAYDTALWTLYKDEAGFTVGSVSSELEIAGTATANYKGAGLTSKISYDLTAPSDIEYIATGFTGGDVTASVWSIITLNIPGSNDPTDQDDWYRWGQEGTTYYAQKKVATSVSTIASGAAGALNNTYKLDFPTTGDDVRFISDSVEKTSDATYALSSRDVAISLVGNFGQDWTPQTITLDTFSATYTAAAPAGGNPWDYQGQQESL